MYALHPWTRKIPGFGNLSLAFAFERSWTLHLARVAMMLTLLLPWMAVAAVGCFGFSDAAQNPRVSLDDSEKPLLVA
jgi:hypothetical protein